MTQELNDRIALQELQPGERLCPQFDISIKFTEDADGSEQFEWQTEGLPPGRRHNSVHFYPRMYREPATLESVEKDAEKLWLGYRSQKCSGTEGKGSLHVRYLRSEVWCCNWFSHYTFDVGMSDQEVMASFRRYVWRARLANERHRRESSGLAHLPDLYSLMGAEDEWRWRSQPTPDSPGGVAPCRCAKCKELGIVGVDH